MNEETAASSSASLQSGAGETSNTDGGRPSFVVGSYRGLGALPVKGQSFCTCPVEIQERSRYLRCNCGEDDVRPEWIWDPESASGATELSDDGQTVRFHVKFSCGTAAVRGAKELTSGQYFWEIKMITPVYGTDMMVGVGTSMVELDSYKAQFCSLLGRDAESWGLSYMGRLHHKAQFAQFGTKFGQGSIIGVHLDMWHGTLTFYKNRRPMGISISGLKGKVLYPMLCSTAAQSGMKLIKARSFQTSLQFMCCQALRRIIPRHLDVFDVLPLPPGLKEFLANNLSWLLQRQDQQGVQDGGRDEEKWMDLPEEDDDEDDKSDTSSEAAWTPAASPADADAPSWVGAFEGSQLWANKSTKQAVSAESSGEQAATSQSEAAPSTSTDSMERPTWCTSVSTQLKVQHAGVSEGDIRTQNITIELSDTTETEAEVNDKEEPGTADSVQDFRLRSTDSCLTEICNEEADDDIECDTTSKSDASDSSNDQSGPNSKRRKIDQ